ncbi:hypothetical protein [Woodsholea maritima]|nr:hypothetical protein [Woodsholea maritima]
MPLPENYDSLDAYTGACLVWGLGLEAQIYDLQKRTDILLSGTASHDGR